MASFQVKIPAKGQEREKKKIALMGSNPTRNREFKKNSKKKIKTLENTIISSFQAKIGLERLRKRENLKKKNVPRDFYPTHNRKFQKNSKKIKKLENTIMASFQAKIEWERPKKRENKNYRFD